MNKSIQILVVDDSALVRQFMTELSPANPIWHYWPPRQIPLLP